MEDHAAQEWCLGIGGSTVAQSCFRRYIPSWTKSARLEAPTRGPSDTIWAPSLLIFVLGSTSIQSGLSRCRRNGPNNSDVRRSDLRRGDCASWDRRCVGPVTASEFTWS
jgi:hypothetical protein